MKYNLWKHGSNIKVYDTKRKKYGVVTKIKETAPEWIEPFVLFEGEETIMVTNPNDLLVVEEK